MTEAARPLLGTIPWADPQWPHIESFDSVEDWVRARMIPDAEA